MRPYITLVFLVLRDRGEGPPSQRCRRKDPDRDWEGTIPRIPVEGRDLLDGVKYTVAGGQV
jgi:hypothetical protein